LDDEPGKNSKSIVFGLLSGSDALLIKPRSRLALSLPRLLFSLGKVMDDNTERKCSTKKFRIIVFCISSRISSRNCLLSLYYGSLGALDYVEP
jgi:hypothetical protein